MFADPLEGEPEEQDEAHDQHLCGPEQNYGDHKPQKTLTGGELAAMAMIDATVRLLPNVLGNAASTEEESFSNGLLEHPQYTRPAEWNGRKIPDVLMSGHHGEIAKWRRAQSERLTRERRPDLWQAHQDKPEQG